MKHRTLKAVSVVLCSLACAVANVQGQQPPAGAMPGMGAAGPTQVGVITLQLQTTNVTTELPGRVSASQTADVRPQVGGIVKVVAFQGGQQVKAGDVLFELDDASYQAQLDVQSAAVQKMEAAQSSAQAKVERFTQLGANVSQSDLLDAQVALAQAKADTASAEANLKSAQLNLSFTKVTAPISGIISEPAVTQGALVTAAQATALAIVRSLDPAYVDMVDTSANLLNLRRQLQNGSIQNGSSGRPPAGTVSLILENGEHYAETGTITSPDVVVSESTSTFSIRASFPNPQRVLLPGMFVHAVLDLGIKQQGFLVPQRAVTFDAAGEPTALFVEGGKAVSHVLTTSGNSGNNWIVTKGIADGAQVIVDGLQKVREGAEVSAVEVTLDADGVVVETTAAPTAAASTPGGAAPPAASVPTDSASGAPAGSAPSASQGE